MNQANNQNNNGMNFNFAVDSKSNNNNNMFDFGIQNNQNQNQFNMNMSTNNNNFKIFIRYLYYFFLATAFFLTGAFFTGFSSLTSCLNVLIPLAMFFAIAGILADPNKIKTKTTIKIISQIPPRIIHPFDLFSHITIKTI